MVKTPSGKPLNPLTKQPVQLLNELVPHVCYKYSNYGTK